MFLGLGVTCDGIPFSVFLCLLVFCLLLLLLLFFFFYGWEHQWKYYRVQFLSCNINNVWKSLVDIASLSSIPHRFLLFRRTSGIQWWSSPVGKLGSKAKWHKVSKGLMPHFFLSPLTSGLEVNFLVHLQVLLVRYFSTSKLLRSLANSFPLFGTHGYPNSQTFASRYFSHS